MRECPSTSGVMVGCHLLDRDARPTARPMTRTTRRHPGCFSNAPIDRVGPVATTIGDRCVVPLPGDGRLVSGRLGPHGDTPGVLVVAGARGAPRRGLDHHRVGDRGHGNPHLHRVDHQHPPSCRSGEPPSPPRGAGAWWMGPWDPIGRQVWLPVRFGAACGLSGASSEVLSTPKRTGSGPIRLVRFDSGGGNHPELTCLVHRLGARRDTQLPVDGDGVGLRRVAADEELLADLAERQLRR